MKKSVYNELLARVEALEKLVNGGAGSGNFGHAGRPGKRGGSGKGGLSGISKAIATQKKFQDQAKIVQEDIEDRIGQKIKKGEEYTALDEASGSRFKEFHGEDGTEYTYDKENGMITKTNPKTGDQEVVTKQKKDSKKAGEKKMTKAEATEVLDKIADDIMGGTLEDYDYSFEKLVSPVKSGQLSKKQARELMITGKPQLTTDKKTIYVATQTELHTWPTSPKDSSQTMKEARDYWREAEGDY